MAADALGAIGPDAHQAVFYLLEILQEPGEVPPATSFRLRVARALWRIQQEPSYLLAIAVESLDSPTWGLRRIAAAALGDLGAAGRAVIPHLQRMLEDEHPSVRRLAAKSLEKITPPPAD
jgi:HEAT repeat protein